MRRAPPSYLQVHPSSPIWGQSGTLPFSCSSDILHSKQMPVQQISQSTSSQVHSVDLTSTMTLFPPMMIGVMNTQNMSYKKHSGSSMQATCRTGQHISPRLEGAVFCYQKGTACAVPQQNDLGSSPG